MGKSNQLKKGVLLNYLNLALGSLVPLLYTPIMLSILGQDEYGLYKLSGSITSYLSLMAMGLGAAITRYLIKARIEQGKEAEERMLGLFVAIFSVIALLTLLAGTLLASNVNRWYEASLSADNLQKMKLLVFLMACNTSVSFLLAPFISVVNAHERFVFLQSMGILATCITPLLSLVALFIGYASLGLAIVSLSVAIINRILYSLYVKRKMHLKIRFSRSSLASLKDILAFSFWIFVSNIVNSLYGATDTVMIGFIPRLATAGVAIYAIGEIITSMISTLNSGISSLLIPKANKMVFGKATNDDLTETAIRMGRLQCLVIALFIFGFIAFGRPFIHFYAGDEYAQSYWVAVICMIPLAVPLMQSFCLNLLIAKNKNKFRALVYLFIAVVNVVGTWFLLQVWGIIGAALMTSIAYLLGNGIIMNWFYHKHMKINIIKFWNNMGQILIWPVLLCICVLFLAEVIDFYNIYCFLTGIILFSIFYFAINWKVVMNEYEKELVRSFVPKIRCLNRNC